VKPYENTTNDLNITTNITQHDIISINPPSSELHSFIITKPRISQKSQSTLQASHSGLSYARTGIGGITCRGFNPKLVGDRLANLLLHRKAEWKATF
jgi:hypothetical protein